SSDVCSSDLDSVSAYVNTTRGGEGSSAPDSSSSLAIRAMYEGKPQIANPPSPTDRRSRPYSSATSGSKSDRRIVRSPRARLVATARIQARDFAAADAWAGPGGAAKLRR